MESWPWKRDLGLAADRLEEAEFGLARLLERHGVESDEGAEALYQVERDVMASAFAARRLIGMPSKVTKGARAASVAVTRLPLRDGEGAPDLWDVLCGLEMYEIAEPRSAEISANELCNLFVHSRVLRLAWTVEDLPWAAYNVLSEEDPRFEDTPMELAGVLVASDKSGSQHLTFVSLAELVRVFRVFANDVVTTVVGRRDQRGGTRITAR